MLTVATDSELQAVAVKQSQRKISVSTVRGGIFDCNGKSLTDKTYRSVTVQLPSANAAVTLAEMLEGRELEAALKRLRSGQAVTVWDRWPDTDGIWVRLSVPTRYDGSLCHVLGYLDSTGHGAVGVEKAFDDILFSDKSLGVSYVADSLGRALEGVEPSVDTATAEGSVTLTVDSVIQSFSEQAMAEVQSGAALVIEAGTGKIKALVSRPDFDPYDIASALDDSNSPLINRACYAYNVGSVFKPLIAAVALENGMEDYRYKCNGSVTVGDVTFKCNRTAGHGELGLSEALAVSCNTYFYTLGAELGAEKVHTAAANLRFGQALSCGGGLNSSKGILPDSETLKSIPAELTNLSVGQGELMLSPIALSVLYSAVISGGEYCLPYLVESTSVDGAVTEYRPSPKTKVFSKATAEKLKVMLQNALENGTGSEAFVQNTVSGGKTGTAQTGWIEDGRSILNGWFCGFYEGKAEYVIVVLKEDVKSGSTDCAPIFKKIVTDLKNNGY